MVKASWKCMKKQQQNVYMHTHTHTHTHTKEDKKKNNSAGWALIINAPAIEF